VNAHGCGLSATTGDLVLFSIQMHGFPAATGGFQAAADGPCAGIFDVHAFMAVMGHEEVLGHPVVHERGITGTRLDDIGRQHEEIIGQLLIVQQGNGALRHGIGAGRLENQVFQGIGGRFSIYGQTTDGNRIEGVAGQHAADHAHGGEAVDGGLDDPVLFQQFQHFIIRDATGCDVLFIPGVEDLADASGRHAGNGVFIEHGQVQCFDQLEGFNKGAGLVVRQPLEPLRNFRVLFLLLGIAFHRFQATGFLGIIGNPGLQAFNCEDDRFVVVQAVHADDTVTIRATGHFVLEFPGHLNDPVKPVFQGIEIVDDFTSLGKGESGIEHADDVAHDGFLDVILGNHLFILVAQIVHGLAIPHLGQFQQNRNLFLAHAEFSGDGYNLVKALGHVTATLAEL